MITRRDCIQKVYQRQLQLHGKITSHLVVRRFIREEMLAQGLSLSPLKWTSHRHPKSFDLYIKWYRLRHGTVSTVDYDQKMKDMAEQRDREVKSRYRRTRQRLVGFRCHQWEMDGPKLTLLELARQYANAVDSSDPIYRDIKELYLKGMEAREAIEQTLAEAAEEEAEHNTNLNQEQDEEGNT